MTVTLQNAAFTSRTKREREHRSVVKIMNDLSYVDVGVRVQGDITETIRVTLRVI
jgi:hypothetical protein